jgi:hypothetical protein
MNHLARILAIVTFCILGTNVCAQPPGPPPPEKYKVTLRYYIPSPRDEHVAIYDAMIRQLQKIGFEFDPPLEKHAETDREDRTKNYLTGYIAASKKLHLLDPLVVQSSILIPFAPDEFKLPDGGDEPVTVRLELAGNLTPDRQRELSNQTRVLLRELGFKEPVAYDHRGYFRKPYTRIVGTIPRGKLDILNRDLRNHPAGWVGPILPRNEIPVPLREINPVQFIEVMPDGEAIKELADFEPRVPEEMEKISPDLWELVKGKDVPTQRIRVQIGFNGTIGERDQAWKTMLQETAPGIFIEAQFGVYVTAIVRLDQVKTLASSSLVSFMRLPRPPSVDVDPGIKTKGDNAKALEQSGLKDLHARGNKGQGVRIAIIDRDFRGWKQLVDEKKLPAKTTLVDLTTSEDPDVYPRHFVGDAKAIGHGTLCAQAAALAAPDAELMLIRIDVIDPSQLQDIVRYIQGGKFSSLVEYRNGALLAYAAQLSARRAELLEERRIVLNDFSDETDKKHFLGFLGPVYAWLYSDREWHRQRMDAHEKLEAEQRQREDRYRSHLKEIERLAGIPIIVNALTWNSGYPLGSASPLSRLLDQDKGPLWFQAAGNTRGQAWFGLYRGVTGDPGMMFGDESVKLPKNRWTREINFLDWQPHHGQRKPELPAKTKLRFTLQWREPHDPDYYLTDDDEDLYRRPLANLRLQLIRQRDPETKKLPADSFELIARTGAWPQRLEHHPNGSVYEHVLETTVGDAGRYAIRVEKQLSSLWLLTPHPERKTPVFRLLDGLTPSGIRPLGAPTLPALEKDWELRLRVFVEVLDDANRLHGRAVIADFATDTGSIGIPMDARNVVSVGAATFDHKPQPYSAFGSPVGMELSRRPWLYAYDELELAGGGAYGTSVANAFAAGAVASMMSAKLGREEIVRLLRAQEGQVLRAVVGSKR